ncbi:RloB family protein [Myroides sp. DF42-4-2]|uniref:RloB family protein n=1 Tax=Myroides sp. DF42-4-2 TaxID=2746726 RepID=UPI00257787D8|nr:RloB family protein [Myroides sp. DF42-4-2]MDM1408699.1 RloB domain-containing protein [Myroides sp. DF42-4-2]
MSRKQRGYSRDLPDELLKDYRLFAIACEGGKREPDYFKILQHLSNRIKIDVIDEKVSEEGLEEILGTKSSPKWVLERARTYLEEEKFGKDDFLWFVIDIDRWKMKDIIEIFNFCKTKGQWNLVLSNPCFESWLYLHKSDNIEKLKNKTCKDLKAEIDSLEKGGYNPLTFLPNIKDAAYNARKLDNDINQFLPDKYNSKIYLLIEAVLDFCSVQEFDYFIEYTIPNLLIAENKSRHEKRKKRVLIKK